MRLVGSCSSAFDWAGVSTAPGCLNGVRLPRPCEVKLEIYTCDVTTAAIRPIYLPMQGRRPQRAVNANYVCSYRSSVGSLRMQGTLARLRLAAALTRLLVARGKIVGQ
jgi:hypothetical protein